DSFDYLWPEMSETEALFREAEFLIDGKGNRQAAVVAWSRAYGCVHLGRAQEARGDWNGAIAEYRKVLSLDPELSWGHVHLGKALARKGEFAEAIAVFHKAIEINPKQAGAHHALGD